MTLEEYKTEANKIWEKLKQDPELKSYIDTDHEPPAPFGPPQGARLIVLGQDPTTKSKITRQSITVVLNLNQTKGTLYRYIQGICGFFNIELDRVYAVNLINNFFSVLPASNSLWFSKLEKAASAWMPLLKNQLDAHPGAPIISLGEPVLKIIASKEAPKNLRSYWGYTRSHEPAQPDRFKALGSESNVLNRTVYPFPHANTLRKAFYRDALLYYKEFVSTKI